MIYGPIQLRMQRQIGPLHVHGGADGITIGEWHSNKLLVATRPPQPPHQPSISGLFLKQRPYSCLPRRRLPAYPNTSAVFSECFLTNLIKRTLACRSGRVCGFGACFGVLAAIRLALVAILAHSSRHDHMVHCCVLVGKDEVGDMSGSV